MYSIPRAQQDFIFFKCSITIMILLSVCYRELTALCDSSVDRGSFQSSPFALEQSRSQELAALQLNVLWVALPLSTPAPGVNQGQGPAPEAEKPPEPRQNQ